LHSIELQRYKSVPGHNLSSSPVVFVYFDPFGKNFFEGNNNLVR